MRKFSHLILILLLLAVYGVAYADYHYASHEGSNEYPYTSWETATDSIQKAIDASDPGDTIYIGEGLWDEATQVWTNSLALIGMGIDNTEWQNEVTTQIKFYADTMLVEGISFINNYDLRFGSAISCLEHGQVEIFNNYFYGHAAGISGNLGGKIYNNYFENNYSALRTTGIREELIFNNNTIYLNLQFGSVDIMDLYADTSKFHIRNNLFYRGRQGDVFTTWWTVETDTVFIHNNVIYKRIISGGSGYPSFGLATIYIMFYNNTIDGMFEGINPDIVHIVGIQESSTDSLMTLDNNIVANCEVGVMTTTSETPPLIRYSNFYNITEEYFHGPGEFLEGNIFTDPMFVDTLDFHLQAFSLCIDAGNPEIFDPDSSRSDIGAYGGPYGEYYEYLDLPPDIPDSLIAEVSAGNDTIYLNWTYNTESDFNRYYIHRDTVDGFEPSVFNLIAEPDTSLYIDTDFDLQHSYYYRIAAIDNQDNLSDYSNQLGVIFTGFDDFDPNLPRSAVLYQNYPNPFNQRTIIRFYLPDIGVQPAEARLEIYDVLGRLVRSLVNERRYPGEYEVVWDGRDDSGSELSSGMYFYRLFVSKAEFTKPKKLMLIK